jgi:hypothetical protein
VNIPAAVEEFERKGRLCNEILSTVDQVDSILIKSKGDYTDADTGKTSAL